MNMIYMQILRTSKGFRFNFLGIEKNSSFDIRYICITDSTFIKIFFGPITNMFQLIQRIKMNVMVGILKNICNIINEPLLIINQISL